MEKNTFGEFLREKRRQCGLSQCQLGMLLKVSDKAVSKWENGLARPKSQLLYQLSEILGVTVDELLAGGVHPDCEKKKGLAEERHGYLWDKAYSNLMERYADRPPAEMIGRFEMEKLALMNTDMILFFDLLSQLSQSALEKGCPIFQEDGIGASFVAYLLGASNVNPLPAHYYCPVCKKVEFVPGVSDGWELERKYCASCHCALERDGHNIPFEVYRHIIGKNVGFGLVIGRCFHEAAEERIIRYFGNDRIAVLNPPPEVTAGRDISGMTTYVVQRLDRLSPKRDSAVCSYEEYHELISDKPYINLILRDDYEKYIALERMVDFSGTKVDFLDDQVQKALFRGNINEIPTFDLRSLPGLMARFPVKNFRDALQLYGIALNASVLSEAEADSYIDGLGDLSEAISYRDDVYLYICYKMKEHGCLETGLAFQVMDRTRRGYYRRNGMDRHIRSLLLDIGVSEQYIACLEDAAHLFPKALGVVLLRYTLTLLWYRIHCPEEFRHVFGKGAAGSGKGERGSEHGSGESGSEVMPCG